MSLHLFYTFLFLSSVSAEKLYVQSVEDFVLHTMAHKERVVEVASAYFKMLMEQDPNRWGYLSDKRVREFASYHDNPKLDKQNAEKLFQFYGVNREILSSRPRATLENLIAKVESEEKAALSMAFANQEEYRDLEHIVYVADEVDRGMDSVSSEEMGRRTQLASERPKLVRLKKNIENLENRYATIVRGHRLGDVRMMYADNVWQSAAKICNATRQITSCVIRNIQSLAH